MLNPLFMMILVLAMLTAVIHILGTLHSRYNMDREMVRKLLHLIMGSVTLSFPWLFNEPWPVITLSIVASVFIAFIKTSSLRNWKPVVCANGRMSIGELCFPIAVGILFLLSEGNKFLYIAPLAILTFADSASALIGMRFGKRKYHTVDGKKSTEGSLTFLLVAFISTYFCTQTFTSLEPNLAMILSLAVAIIAMLFEAVAWNGLDNMSIPLGAYLAINTHMNLSIDTLAHRVTVLTLMALAFIMLKKKSTLNGSAVLGVVLFCYFALILGGPVWLLSPVALFLSYKYLLPRRFRTLKSFHTIYGVIAVAAAGIVWLLIASDHADPKYLFPYTLAFGAHASIISIAHMRFNQFDKVRTRALIRAVLKAWCLMCVPLVISDPTPHMVSLNLFLAPICIGIPTFLFYIANSETPETITKPRRWFKQAGLASFGAALGFIPFLI